MGKFLKVSYLFLLIITLPTFLLYCYLGVRDMHKYTLLDAVLYVYSLVLFALFMIVMFKQTKKINDINKNLVAVEIDNIGIKENCFFIDYIKDSTKNININLDDIEKFNFKFKDTKENTFPNDFCSGYRLEYFNTYALDINITLKNNETAQISSLFTSKHVRKLYSSIIQVLCEKGIIKKEVYDSIRQPVQSRVWLIRKMTLLAILISILFSYWYFYLK
ncbi:MAG: hypothetical protein II085_05145 [Alphaproteobacteria bacterium]|nr:hypothetical protein [Alphaproteobacteria bacterium]